jgi:hypothetical protein
VKPSVDVCWFLGWSASVPPTGYLCCSACAWWSSLWRLKKARMNSMPIPLGFDNPAFHLQFRDESFQVHHRSSVYAQFERHAIASAADPKRARRFIENGTSACELGRASGSDTCDMPVRARTNAISFLSRALSLIRYCDLAETHLVPSVSTMAVFLPSSSDGSW